MAERVLTYIDGFNLYFGMRDANFRRYFWLNVVEMSRSLLQANQTLAGVKYFSSRISGPDDKRKRQSCYLDALSTCPELRMYYGNFLAKPIRCRACSASWNSQEEKMTDVRIATEMLSDAYMNHFDVAILVSGDSDLVPPIQAIHRDFPKKRVIVFFPPERQSINLKKAAKGSGQIGRAMLSKNQFPLEVTTKSGFKLTKPAEWS